MTVEEKFIVIRVSKLSKKKLDFFKIIKGEPNHAVFGDLIEFGEENDFKRIRLTNLNKKLEDESDRKIKIKQKGNS